VVRREFVQLSSSQIRRGCGGRYRSRSVRGSKPQSMCCCSCTRLSVSYLSCLSRQPGQATLLNAGCNHAVSSDPTTNTAVRGGCEVKMTALSSGIDESRLICSTARNLWGCVSFGPSSLTDVKRRCTYLLGVSVAGEEK